MITVREMQLESHGWTKFFKQHYDQEKIRICTQKTLFGAI
jgi:hypothetical protein